MKILDRYIVSRFCATFLFCVLGVIVIFIIVDLVENVDRFIDAKVPWTRVTLYYLVNIPYVVVLTLPMATILATTLLIGSMTNKNEIVAMKALGYSYYQVMILLLILGLGISVFSFCLAEIIATKITEKRVDIERQYLKKNLEYERDTYNNVVIQEPPYWHVVMVVFNTKNNEAQNITIERFDINTARLKYRYDSKKMTYTNGQWAVIATKNDTIYNRIITDLDEPVTPISDTTLAFPFKFTPKELVQEKIVSEEKSIIELYKFAIRIRDLGGKNHTWMTDVHLRIAFPLSNLLIIFICIPLIYNRHKKSVAEGVGISLLICFFYFGLIKMGQTFGHKQELSPFLGAWMGNGLAFLLGLWNLYRVRK